MLGRYLASGIRRLRSGCGRLTQAVSGNRREIVELSPNRNHTFFGYYDKTPFSLDDGLILGMNLRTTGGDTLDIGCFDLRRGNRFEAFGETTTWSWQLGARLQWLAGRENEIVGYNKAVGGRFGFVLQNVRTGKIEAEYPDPVFDVSPDGRHAVGLNFARLHRMRPGYGYENFPDPSAGQPCPDGDGIVLLDLETKSSKLLLSLPALATLKPRSSMEGAVHYVNHASFSPSGKRFMFLHLWKRGRESFSRPITADIDGREPYVIEDEVNLSHYAWKSDSELLIHTSKRPFGTQFNLYEDLTGNRRTIGEDVLRESGHPSYSPDGGRLIVDTYPDGTRRQRLLLCTSDGDLIEEIGRFHSPIKFSGGEKCDLHPRWDRSGTRICVDSAHKGRRAMYLIGLE
jgi:hypothetical protein